MSGTGKEVVLEEIGERLELIRGIIVFIGPEGSGKTTTALRLAEVSGRPYISTGDTLRHLAKHDFTTAYGAACRRMFDKHEYMDGATLLEILAMRFANDDTADGFILDGGMRTVEETVEFQQVLTTAGRGDLPVRVILLQISDELSIERLVTGSQARGRSDDTIQGVRSRLGKYNHRLNERLKLICDQPNWSLRVVDAMADRNAVFDQVARIVAK